MLRKTLIIVILAVFTLPAIAQLPKEPQDDSTGIAFNKAEPQKKKFKRPKFFDHTYVGGGLGLQFGQFTVIDLSPMVAYELGKVFMGGIGFTYLYNRIRYTSLIIESNTYGGRAFARILPLRNVFSNGDAFFLHGEYEMLNLEENPLAVIKNRVNVPGYIAGLGYQQAIGRRSFTTLSVLWNFNDDLRYPFNNPLFRFGFLIGL
jgi:long-subunit fatty acid transport protein